MYDLRLVYPDGSVGALEVTTAPDAQQTELWQLIGGKGKRWLEPSLQGGWQVTVLPSARARPLFEQLPELLRGLEQQGMPLLLGSSSSPDPLTALAGQLRIVTARQGPTAHPGSIYLMIKQPLDQMGGFSPQTGDPLARWLSNWLAEPDQADNLTKLSRAQADERHVFVITPPFTTAPFPVVDLLVAPNAPLPTAAPALPPPLTHAWAMSSWNSGDGTRYAPREGWSHFAK